MYHDNCAVARGIKHFNCRNCGKPSTNYANGVDICTDCLEDSSLCDICGKSLDINSDNVVEILNNMVVSTIGLVNGDCEKEYKIWEVFELVSKDVVGFVCSLNPNYVWKYDSEYETLVVDKEDVYYASRIEDEYGIEKLLKSTFKIVELKEMDNEWIKINNHFELYKVLINKCKIKLENMILDGNMGETWINVLFEEISKGNVVEYLKENE